MQIDFNIWVIICGAIIVLGFFASFILWIRKENKVSNRLLSLLLLSFSLWMIHTFYSVTGIFRQNANLIKNYFSEVLENKNASIDKLSKKITNEFKSSRE